jgi:hypothetical protein
MKAGLWVLRLLMGCAALFALLCLAYASRLSFHGTAVVGAITFVSLFAIPGFFMFLLFSFACLWGISRGHRVAAILALFVPVFFALPFMAVIVIGMFNIAWIIIPFVLMLAAQASIWPLAFGATATAWYQQWKAAGGDVKSTS